MHSKNIHPWLQGDSGNMDYAEYSAFMPMYSFVWEDTVYITQVPGLNDTRAFTVLLEVLTI